MGDAPPSSVAAPAPPPPIDALPDAVLSTLFECLPPVSVARLMTVCHRWHIVAGDDVLWRRLLRGALLFLPDPLGVERLQLRHQLGAVGRVGRALRRHQRLQIVLPRR